MTLTPAEIEEAISGVNDRIYKALGDGDEFRVFSVKSGSDGYQQWVEFLGEPIWTSEEDGREYRLQSDSHEPLEGFLLKEIRKACAHAREAMGRSGMPHMPREEQVPAIGRRTTNHSENHPAMSQVHRKKKNSPDPALRQVGGLAMELDSTKQEPKPDEEHGPFKITNWKSQWTHDTAGNPLPEFIRNGSVAYAPMIPSPEYARRRKLTLAPNWKAPC